MVQYSVQVSSINKAGHAIFSVNGFHLYIELTHALQEEVGQTAAYVQEVWGPTHHLGHSLQPGVQLAQLLLGCRLLHVPQDAHGCTLLHRCSMYL